MIDPFGFEYGLANHVYVHVTQTCRKGEMGVKIGSRDTPGVMSFDCTSLAPKQGKQNVMKAGEDRTKQN